MSSIIQEVNTFTATMPENSNNGNALIGKEFKITLDELLKGLKTKNEANPLLGLFFALNSTLPLNDENAINPGGITHNESASLAGENSSIMRMLKSILPPDSTTVPLINTVSNGHEVNNKSIFINPSDLNPETIEAVLNDAEITEPGSAKYGNHTQTANGGIQLSKTILTPSDNPTDSGKYVESTNSDPDTIETVLNDAEIAEPGSAKYKNQTQAANENNKQGVLAGISKQGNKDTGNLKKMELHEQASNEKHDLNIINTLSNESYGKVVDDRVSTTVTEPPKLQTGDIIKQITEGAKLSIADNNKSEAVINLKPPNLGKLMLEIIVDKNIVTARITTQNADVKNIIEANINQLKDSLNQQGMYVDSLMVSVDTGGFFGNGHQHGYERRQKYFFTENDNAYESYDFYSYVDKDHVDCIV